MKRPTYLLMAMGEATSHLETEQPRNCQPP